MEPDGRTYLLPYPPVWRILLILGGVFGLLVLTVSFWRALWPPSIVTPFFALFVVLGLRFGGAMIRDALFAPGGSLHFSPGSIEVVRTTAIGQSRVTISSQDIAAFVVEAHAHMEGDDTWHAVIRTKSGETLSSRPLSTRDAAERQLEAFRLALRSDQDDPAPE